MECGAGLPGVGRHARLAAEILKGFLPGPALLDGDLGQEHGARAALFKDYAMAPILNSDRSDIVLFALRIETSMLIPGSSTGSTGRKR